MTEATANAADYDPQADISGCFETALRIKRERGDKHYRVESPIKREVVIGDCRLLLGDCLEILPLLGRVDAVVTDPPYGIKAAGNMADQSGRLCGHGNRRVKKRVYDDKTWDNATADEAVHLAISIADHAIVFGGNYYDLPPSSCWLVWDKLNGSNNFADCELAWTNLPKAVRKIEWLWNGMARKNLEQRFNHPTQKPLGVMEWCLGHLPGKAHTILDPFLGSGTTLVACAKRGKRGIGIERDEGYFNIACERVADAYSRPDMFIEAARPPEPIQQPLFGETAQ